MNKNPREVLHRIKYMQKIRKFYHRKGLNEVYPFPLVMKSGTVLENEGRENCIVLPWFSAGLVAIIPEKEG